MLTRSEGCRQGSKDKRDRDSKKKRGWKEGYEKADTEKETGLVRNRVSFINLELWEKSTAVEEEY